MVKFIHPMKVRLIQVIFLLIAYSSAIDAQKIWTLEACVQRAIEKSLQAQNGDLLLRSSEIDIRQGRHARYPNLSAGANIGWNFGRTIDPTSNQFITETFFNNGLSLSSNVVLYNGNKINNSIRQAEANNKAALKDLEQIKRDISLNVASIYLNILFAKENLANAQRQLDLTKEQKNMIQKQITVGNLPENDILDVEAQIAMNEQTVTENKNLLDMQLLSLKQIMMLDIDDTIDVVVPEGIQVTTDPDLVTFDELFMNAERNQAALQADEMRIRSAELGQKLATADYLPSLFAGGQLRSNYSNKGFVIDGYNPVVVEQDIIFNGQQATIGIPQNVPVLKEQPYFDQINQNLSYGIGISASIPIYNNYSAKLGVQRAKLNLERAQLAYDQTRETLKITVGQAYADAKAAKRRFMAAQKTSETQTVVYENALRKFNAGNINVFELNRMKTSMESAETNFLIAKYDYIFRSRVLDFYMGKPIQLN
ncbi:MAG: outer membrane efflux protein [Bacteroidetes bacterium OLB9]|nr:MAG: outer membrane efflux protein [Bacteroidetes bacterium OLB9]